MLYIYLYYFTMLYLNGTLDEMPSG